MRRNFLIPELSEWINDIDTNRDHYTLTPIRALQLQDVLIHARKEIIELNKQVDGQPEEESEVTKQAKAEIQKKMAKLGIKG